MRIYPWPSFTESRTAETLFISDDSDSQRVLRSAMKRCPSPSLVILISDVCIGGGKARPVWLTNMDLLENLLFARTQLSVSGSDPPFRRSGGIYATGRPIIGTMIVGGFLRCSELYISLHLFDLAVVGFRLELFAHFTQPCRCLLFFCLFRGLKCESCLGVVIVYCCLLLWLSWILGTEHGKTLRWCRRVVWLIWEMIGILAFALSGVTTVMEEFNGRRQLSVASYVWTEWTIWKSH